MRQELYGDLTYNPNNKLTNVAVLDKIWDINPSFGGPIMPESRSGSTRPIATGA